MTTVWKKYLVRVFFVLCNQEDEDEANDKGK